MHRNAFTQQQTAKFTMSSLQISLSLRVDESRHDAADWARVWSPSVGKPDAMGEEEDVSPEGEQQCGWVVQIDLPTNKHTPMTHHTMKSCHRPSLQNNCTKKHGIEAQTGSIRNGSMKLCAAWIFETSVKSSTSSMGCFNHELGSIGLSSLIDLLHWRDEWRQDHRNLETFWGFTEWVRWDWRNYFSPVRLKQQSRGLKQRLHSFCCNNV